jgi:ABC-type antimicrobial peptide transport system permease subunit
MKGFIRIRTILLVILAILVLSFFSFDIETFIESPQTQSNLNYVWGGVTYVWTEYLEGPFNYLWYDVFIDLLWDAFINNLLSIEAGEGNSLQQLGENLSPYPTN